MRLTLPRGRSDARARGVTRGATRLRPRSAAATGAKHGRVTPSVAPPAPNAGPAGAGQSSSVFARRALRHRGRRSASSAKAVDLKYTERYAFTRLFKGVSVKIDPDDVGKLAGVASVSGCLSGALLQRSGPTSAVDPDLATAHQDDGRRHCAEQLGLTGDGVKVAVMDTGIDSTTRTSAAMASPAARSPRVVRRDTTSSVTTTTPIRELDVQPRAEPGPRSRRLQRPRNARGRASSERTATGRTAHSVLLRRSASAHIACSAATARRPTTS